MANIIKLKRGLKANLSSLSLESGELAITTDTNELFAQKSDGTLENLTPKILELIHINRDDITLNLEYYESTNVYEYCGELEGVTIKSGVEYHLIVGSEAVTQVAQTYTDGIEKISYLASNPDFMYWYIMEGDTETTSYTPTDSDWLIFEGTIYGEYYPFVFVSRKERDSIMLMIDATYYQEKEEFQLQNNIISAPKTSGVRQVTAGEAAEAAAAFGQYTYATGTGSFTSGNFTQATGIYSHAEGYGTLASTEAAHAEGYWTQATGHQSHAEGSSTVASGAYSHAEGSGTTASGEVSHAEGSGTTATAAYSHAEGENSNATKQGAHAEGYESEAAGKYAHAEGYVGNAVGYASHSEGYRTRAYGQGAHAEGTETTAQGSYSHSEGNYTSASVEAAHSEGIHSKADGIAAHAEGYYTIAKGNYTHVEGKYNIEDTSVTAENPNGKYLHISGNGASGARANAYTLDWDGNGWFKGTVKIGGVSYEDETAQELITNTVSNLTNYYSKTELYTKTEINNLINNITTMNIEPVTSLPTSNISTSTIYLLPKPQTEEQNIYLEYMYINNKWEIIGDTKIDLTNYVTKAELQSSVETIGIIEHKDLSEIFTSGYYIFGEGITDRLATPDSMYVPLNANVGLLNHCQLSNRKGTSYYYINQAIVTGGIFYIRFLSLKADDLSVDRVGDWSYRGLDSVMMEERFFPFTGWLESGAYQEWDYPDIRFWNQYSTYVLSKEKIAQDPVTTYVPIELGQDLSRERLFFFFPEPLDNGTNYYPGLFSSDTYVVQELFSGGTSRVVLKRKSDNEIIKTFYEDTGGDVSINLEAYLLPADFGVVTSITEGRWGTTNQFIKIESTQWPGTDASNELKVELFDKKFRVTNVGATGCEYKVLLARIY